MKLLRKNIGFLLPFFLFLILGLYFILSYTNEQLFFFVNDRYNKWEDLSMPYYTNVGDGVTLIALGLCLAFIRIRYGMIMLAGFALEGLLVQVMKRYIFSDHVRPWKEWGDKVHLVTGFTPYQNNSFPSGHTATAFCMFALIAFMLPNKKWGALLFLPALLVAYSRIYLAQHHFIDVYAGAVIGVLAAVLVYLYFYSPQRKFNQEASWLDRPLHKLKKHER